MFCVRGFGGGLGFLSFLGGCSGLSVVFSRASGVSWFLACSAPCVGVGGGLWGVLGFGVWRACFLLFFSWGAGWGCACARLSGLLPPCWGAGSGARVARFPWWGSGCARFPVRVRGVVVVFAGGFRVLFFPSGALCFLLVSGVGLRGLAGGWGVVGGVGLGSGLFFLRLLLYWPGLVSGFLRGGWFGFGLGFVWRV